VRQLDNAYRLPQWQARLADQADDGLVVIAEQGSSIVGLMAVCATSDPILGDRLEVKHLNVEPLMRRQRIGARLLQRAAPHAEVRGARGLALSVVEGNDDALAFYETLGGKIAGRFTDPGPLWRSRNLIVVWDDLFRLAAGGKPPR
jgi:GNAT superfamily N-acetyltransferase